MNNKLLKRVTTGCIIIFVFLYIVFGFIFTFYRMPDKTMEDTIQKGELLLINKLAGGDFFFGLKMPSFSKFKVDDIIYFLDPMDEDAPFHSRKRVIARVMACPGDKYQMKTRQVYINDHFYEEPTTLKHSYRIVANEGVKLDTNFFNKYGLSEQINETSKWNLPDKYRELYSLNEEGELSIWDVPMTKEKSIEVANDSLISYVSLVRSTVPGRYINIWPYSHYWMWNRWHTPDPFDVPEKGMLIKTTIRTIGAYDEIIEKYEGNKLIINDKNQVLINDKISNRYTVKENYYIVLSDNRDRFYDTRTWGLLPEKYIIGKVINK